MASGDTVFETTALRVVSDDTDKSTGTVVQTTAFTATGSMVVPATGDPGGSATLNTPVELSIKRPNASGNGVETLFDASKSYVLTITEA